MQTSHQTVLRTLEVPLAAAFRSVSPDVRTAQWNFHILARTIFDENGIDLHMLWRDGTADPRESFDVLLKEDIVLHIESSPILAMFTGYASDGLEVLLEIARARRRSLLLFNLPGTPPVFPRNTTVIAQLSLDNLDRFRHELSETAFLIAESLRSTSESPLTADQQRQLLADPRPSRLKRLRSNYRPNGLSISYLSRRTGLPESYLKALEVAPWDLLNIDDEQIGRIAWRLGEPSEALLAETDDEAGKLRRLAQVMHSAWVRGTPRRERRHLLQMLETRTDDPIALFDVHTLHFMFKKAASDAAAEDEESNR